jgi:hypothetical protein
MFKIFPLFLMLILFSNNICIGKSINLSFFEDSNSVLKIKPLVGFKIFNPYSKADGFMKGVLTLSPQIGVDFIIKDKKSCFSIRKEFFYVFVPTANVSELVYKSEGWMFEYKYAPFKHKNLKGIQLGTGVSFWNNHNITEHFLGIDSNPDEFGVLLFASIPCKYLRFELRTDFLLLPVDEFEQFHPYSICITYNFLRK